MTLPTHTTNFNIPIPAPGQRGFQDEYVAGFQTFDSLLATYISVNNFVGVWENSTVYTATQTVVDAIAGGVWRCEQAHTSPAAPTTFAAYRAANPSVWTNASLEVRNRGIWASATEYRVGDFIATASSNGKIAICLVAHTSGGTFAADLALSYWSVLVDLSNYATSAFVGSIAALSPVAADRMIYSSATDTAAVLAATSFGRGLLALADAAALAALHEHDGTDITSGTVAAARLGSGTPDITTFLRGDNSWQVVSSTQTIETITGNDTLSNADKGKMFLVTADATVAIDAISGLDSDWWVDLVRICDSNVLGYVVVNPNSSEEIDGQATVAGYANECFRIHKRTTAYKTDRGSHVFFGNMTLSGDPVDFYVNNLFLDDPEIWKVEILIENASHDGGANRTLGLELLDTTGSAHGGNTFNRGQITQFAATTVGTEGNADTIGGASIAAGNTWEPVWIEIVKGVGTAAVRVQWIVTGSSPDPLWSNAALLPGGVRFNVEGGAGSFDAGTYTATGYRRRLA